VYVFSVFPLRTTCVTRPILLDLTTLTVLINGINFLIRPLYVQGIFLLCGLGS
jgi:hypothetical protein